jgi:hypothetical protein
MFCVLQQRSHHIYQHYLLKIPLMQIFNTEKSNDATVSTLSQSANRVVQKTNTMLIFKGNCRKRKTLQS